MIQKKLNVFIIHTACLSTDILDELTGGRGKKSRINVSYERARERERETGLIFQFLTLTYMASVHLPLSHVMFMFSNPERKCKRQNALNGSMHDKASSRSAAVFFFFYTSLSANSQREGIFVFVSHNRTNT